MKFSLKIIFRIIIVCSTFLFLFSYCKKESECENSHSAKLVDMTGLDGCSWMIELNNGSKLEPTNLNDFSINLQDNKKIWVVYHSAPQMASICMHGEIVTIDCISER